LTAYRPSFARCLSPSVRRLSTVARLKDRPNSLGLFERLLSARDLVVAVGGPGEIAPNRSRVVASAARIEGVALVVLPCPLTLLKAILGLFQVGKQR